MDLYIKHANRCTKCRPWQPCAIGAQLLALGAENLTDIVTGKRGVS